MGRRIYELLDTAHALIHALAERAPAGVNLGSLGAGPIGSCLGSDEASLRWVEDEARRSENFRKALAVVWMEELGPAAFLRVQREPEPSSSGTSAPGRGHCPTDPLSIRVKVVR